MPKLKLGSYPYTYVRTVVEKSLLLKKEDYDKLLKMSFNEIAKHLQEGTFKDDINRHASSLSGAFLIETALFENLGRTFKKLKRVSEGNLNLLIEKYLKRYDILNVKNILRAIYTGLPADTIKFPITGSLKSQTLLEIASKKSIEEALSMSRLLSKSILSETLRKFKDASNLMEIENALDKAYYSEMTSFAGTVESRIFAGFLNGQAEMLNIITILKLKKESVKEIKEFMIKTDVLGKNFVSILSSDNLDLCVEALSKSAMGKILSKGISEFKETGSLIGIERDLYVNLLRKTQLLSHQNPLSADVIIEFMFAKDIEVRNLSALIKGKQAGLSSDIIENNLVIS